MAWNEPGGGKDPWGNRQNEPGPPDLDQILRKIQEKMGSLFGGGGGGGSANPSPSMAGPIGVVLVILFVLWLGVGGFYTVDQGKRGVVTRFGAWVQTTMPGPHWHIPWPIERVEKVDVEQTQTVEIGYGSSAGDVDRSPLDEALMLTKDENIVDVRLAVQYKIKDPRAYLFSVRNPEESLRDVTESALREVVGRSTMDYVLGAGQTAVSIDVAKIVRSVLDEYDTGLELIGEVKLQKVQLPEPVQPAVADQTKAREDKQRYIFEAEAYMNEVLPKAGGQAARVMSEAEAYRQRVIAQAEGDASRFEKIVSEYRKAPEVTRKRMYIETIESVLAQTSKVVVGASGNQLNVLPLDKLMQASTGRANSETGSSYANSFATPSRVTPNETGATQPIDAGDARVRDSAREREVR